MPMRLKLKSLSDSDSSGRLHVRISTDEAVRPRLEICDSDCFPYRGHFIKFRGYLGAEGFRKNFVRVCYAGITYHEDRLEDIKNIESLLSIVSRHNTPDIGNALMDLEFPEGTIIHYTPECKCSKVTFDYHTSKPVSQPTQQPSAPLLHAM